MDIILKRLGQTIKKYRLSANLAQDELSERVGITGRYIMALENEKTANAAIFPMR